MQRVQIYVTAVAVLAGASVVVLGSAAPGLGTDDLIAAACFAGLGFVAQILFYNVGQGVVGSSAFLPFLTAAVLVPTWVSCAAIAAAVALSAFVLRTEPIKAFFNVAQATLSASLAIHVFRALSGAWITADLGERAASSPVHFVLPYIALLLVFAATNTLAVSGVVAINEHRTLRSVVRTSTLTTIGYDVLSVPFVYVFAQVYLAWGPLGVAGLAIPLMGVRQLYKVNFQLAQAHQELLEMMVANLEARDPYTSGHSRRVARNARIIARALGLSARQVDRVVVAALLHDVGKIHEAFAPLLRKPDRLTPEEWAIMQTHPVKSAELVAKSSQLRDVVGPVKHHHENWDGSGYPDGLAGEEIPLGARIIMFADTVDAMTTDRPYRNALTPEAVRAELVRMRGRQFDPSICDVLLVSPQFPLLFADPSKHVTPAFPVRPLRARRVAGSQ